MLGRTVYAATLFAVAQLAVANPPPACLLNAASQYGASVDLKSICQSKDLKAMVSQICGSDLEAAMAAITETCKQQNVDIGSAPSGNPSVPAGNATVPTGNPSVPTGNPSAPAGNATVPTGNPSVPTGNPSVPAGNPYVPAGPTGSPSTPTGAAPPCETPLYPTGSSSGTGSHGGYGGSNGTVSTGGLKPPTPTPTDNGSKLPSPNSAGKVEFGLAAVVAGFLAAVL